MKNKFKVILLLTSALKTSLAIACDDCSDHKKENKFYIGFEGGVSTPLKKEFTHKATKFNVQVSNSFLYGGLIGYKFYPSMAVEANIQHKPHYKIKFKLPSFNAYGIDQGNTFGKTKIVSDTYMLGLVFDMQQLGAFTPYIGLEGGITRLKTKYVSVSKDIKTGNQSFNKEIFRIKNAFSISPAAQVTLGISSGEILPNLRVNLAGRIQLIKDGVIKYEQLDLKTQKWQSRKLKQTLGVGEIVLGITYDLF